MRSYRINDKILFKYEENSSQIIEKILKVLRDLVRASENRHATNFPIDDLKTLISLCNSLIKAVEDSNIPQDYIDYVNNNKGVLGYFKEIEDRCAVYTGQLKRKKDVFNSFKRSVSRFTDIL